MDARPAPTYAITLHGFPEQSLAAASQALAACFAIEPERARSIVLGAPRVVKSGARPDDARRYVQALTGIGAEVTARCEATGATRSYPARRAMASCPACRAARPAIRSTCVACGWDAANEAYTCRRCRSPVQLQVADGPPAWLIEAALFCLFGVVSAFLGVRVFFAEPYWDFGYYEVFLSRSLSPFLYWLGLASVAGSLGLCSLLAVRVLWTGGSLWRCLFCDIAPPDARLSPWQRDRAELLRARWRTVYLPALVLGWLVLLGLRVLA